VESSCELGNEPSGSIKCWELPNGCTTSDLSSGTQFQRVSKLVKTKGHVHSRCRVIYGIYGAIAHKMTTALVPL
jgi:hypothetical protein